MKMKLRSNFSLNTKELLAHHDVVFRAPVCDPVYGLPLGDGNTGTLFWLSEDTLHVQINNTDFVDDIREGEEYCPVFDEMMTVCRNGGQLNIKFPCPVFDTIYQNQFEGRLSIGDATALIHADTPFAKTDIRAFASSEHKVTVVTVETAFTEEMEISSRLNRWGSRSLTHAHAVYHEDTSIGLSGTESQVELECMCITQKMQGSSFCIALKPVAADLLKMQRKSSHELEANFASGTHMLHTYYITAAVAETPEDAKEKALHQIAAAYELGTEALYAEHVKDWETFWNKSYVSLPEKQDFLENIWYLNLYYSNCMMRGEYPYLPWNSIWGFNHDYSPWSNILHWNSQSGTFPLDAANHSELANTYYRFCRNMLPQAERYAKNIKKKKGAFFVDLCDLKGRMDLTPHYLCIDNCSVGAHIAMEMYQYYRYTGDERFLEESVLPVMRGAAEYYLDELKLGDDGYYHIYGTSGYEDPLLVYDDTVTDLAAIRSLYGALITLVSEEEAAPYKERLEKLVPFHTADFYEEEVGENGIFQCGLGEGRKVFTDKLLAAGLHPRISKDLIEFDLIDDRIKWIAQQEKGRLCVGFDKYTAFGHPEQELFTVFPSNLIGIKDKGTELYNLVANCACVEKECLIGWSRMPLFLARLGMADLLEKTLEQILSVRVIFPQGILTDFPPGSESDGHSDYASMNNWFVNRWGRNPIRQQVVKNGVRIPLTETTQSTAPMWKFRHFNFEVGPLVGAAVNEMLLQSYDGTIRLFPAILPDSQVSFRLAAIDGRMVEAIFCQGECDVLITCKRGGTLRVAAENINGPLFFSDADSKESVFPSEEHGVYTMETATGQKISVRTAKGENLTIEKDYSRNMDVKFWGKAKLGTEKEF